MKICIAGDEWACGEYSFINNKYYGVVHKGLEQYLKDENIEVVNLSERNISNIKIYEKLTKIDLRDFDYILYFQVDPFRDAPIEEIVSSFSNLEVFKKEYEKLLINHYSRLQSLNVPIYLLGGSAKISNLDVEKFTNLKVLLPSLIEFCIPTMQHPAVWPSGWEQLLTNINLDIDPNVVNFVCNEKLKRDATMNKQDVLINKYFHPDGKQLNRTAHYELYKFIRKNLLKIEEEN